MKKALKNKLSGTKKLVRSVLSKPSAPSPSHDSISHNIEGDMAEETDLLKNELEALKDQIMNLKAAIQTLQNETEQKEVYIANLAREKETLGLDLLKTRRSNVSLTQQLEEERKYYFKEKEIYCKEMNECKKLKKILSNSVTSCEERSVEWYRNEISKLKQTLNETLEANYNLSIKFLRMKNTKTCLKTELQTTKLEHEKLQNDYKTKIENLTTELNDLVNEKMSTTQCSPSSKKYLQLVKQNSCLVYENLCLQLEVDNLNLKFEKLKLEKTRSETNDNLKYIHHGNSHGSRSVRIQNETPEKLEKVVNKPCCSKSQIKEDEKIVKIFERKEAPGIPNIKIINEKKQKEKKPRKKKISGHGNDHHNQPTIAKTENLLQTDISYNYKEKINKNSAKLDLFQVSNMHSVVSSEFVSAASTSSGLKKSLSTPDILQHFEFKENP
ncbi:unnamed protein product [Phaedon cochleariae]|uniref:Uncharacterized protein n=1 Tax=Phaedon cochleariae TaxID=80249 RepID=A0A9P0DNA2_PHACE|nr:unnamed protein product [Phaedon cochleariae]